MATTEEQIKAKVDEIGYSFEAFKAKNDQALEELRKKGHVSAELAEQVDKINAAITNLEKEKARMDAIEASMNRSNFGGGGDQALERARADHSKAFSQFFRKGHDAGLKDLQIQAALSTDSDPDGGFTVPVEVDTAITRVLGKVSTMRSLARIQSVGSATYKKIHNVGGTSSGWVGERTAPTETATPQLKELEFPVMTVYSEPRATQSILDDSFFNIESWLSDEVSIEFAEQEGSAFINGDGVNKPRGILGYNLVANAGVTFGNIGFIKTGVNGGLHATAPGDNIIDLIHSLKPGYRQNAKLLMNDTTLATLRKIKDTTGEYIWQMPFTDNVPGLILGQNYVIDDNMPDIAANSYSIAYADFNRAYIITDRAGVRVLRDPYTAKPYIKFYTTKRVGGGVQDFDAIKFLKFTA